MRRRERGLADAAGTLLRAFSLLVPRSRRGEWLEAWRAELSALREARAAGSRGLPHPVLFALGAVRHAGWERTRDWSLDALLLDLRWAFRSLARSPLFATVAVVTLALGIGANAAVFSVVNGVLFRGAPGIADPDRVVRVGRSYASDPGFDNWSWPAFRRLGEASEPVLSGLAGWARRGVVVGSGSDASRVSAELVSGSYFPVLGAVPAAGRLLGPSDSRAPGEGSAAVLSHALWTARYGADPGVVGRSITVNSLPFEVVGVAPRGFVGVDKLGSPPAIWLPVTVYGPLLGADDDPFERTGWNWLFVVGRLSPGTTVEEAGEALAAVAPALEAEDPSLAGARVVVAGGTGLDPEGRAEGRFLALLLMGVGAAVLLVTCANVGNLLLARATTRSAEMGVRSAVGAGRGRIARQLVTESALLGTAGLALALPLAWSGEALAPLLFPRDPALDLSPDLRVVAFAAATTAAAVLLFGLAPAWRTARADVARLVREGAPSGRGGGRVRSALVVGQIAVTLALLSAAGLLGTSLVNLGRADPGFELEGLVVADVHPGLLNRYDDEAALLLYGRLLDAVDALPGVASATVADAVPLAAGQSSGVVYASPDPSPADPGTVVDLVVAGPRYFETLGIPVVRGRGFGPDPARDLARPAVVVNESLARALWPGEDPLARTLDRRGRSLEVVGVVADAAHRSVRRLHRPVAYLPLHQEPVGSVTLHLRAGPEAGGLSTAVTRVLRELDPDLPVGPVVPLGDLVRRARDPDARVLALLVGGLSFLALSLAAVGLYGVLAFTVARRTRELGVRSALGAGRGRIVRMVVGRSLALAGLGIAGGVVLALAAGRVLSALLYGVRPADPWTLGATSATLLAVALAAAWIPARRAARVDAVRALRDGVALVAALLLAGPAPAAAAQSPETATPAPAVDVSGTWDATFAAAVRRQGELTRQEWEARVSGDRMEGFMALTLRLGTGVRRSGGRPWRAERRAIGPTPEPPRSRPARRIPLAAQATPYAGSPGWGNPSGMALRRIHSRKYGSSTAVRSPAVRWPLSRRASTALRMDPAVGRSHAAAAARE